MSKNTCFISYRVHEPEAGSFKAYEGETGKTVTLSIGNDLNIFFDDRETALRNLQSWVMCLDRCIVNLKK